MINIVKIIRKAFSPTENVTEEDLIKIRKADWDTCAKWWGILNRWEWPLELLPEESPSIEWKETNRRHSLMDVINKKTGHKYILRKLNMERGDTEEEFEDWWRGSYDGDKEAYQRWLDRLNKKNISQSQTPNVIP